MWPFGLRSRPPSGVEAVVVLVNGAATRAVMVSAESAKYGPSDLEEGESALYNKTAAVIRIWKDGKITIDADNADLVVNGGNAKVARVGDKAKIVTGLTAPLYQWMKAVETALTSLSGGTPTPATSVDTFASDPGIEISTGADHFLA
jgi:phage gp45-like